jgi:16S rRNA U1498 N3-methylase RsmE
MLYENEDKISLKVFVAGKTIQPDADELFIIVGPEGGFSR